MITVKRNPRQVIVIIVACCCFLGQAVHPWMKWNQWKCERHDKQGIHAILCLQTIMNMAKFTNTKKVNDPIIYAQFHC